MKDLLFVIVLLLISLEYIGTHLLNRYAINLGIPIFKRVLKLNINESLELNGTIAKDEGKFRFFSPTDCVFTSRFRLFSFFRFQLPILIKGTIVHDTEKAIAIGRIPVGSIFILVFVLRFLHLSDSVSKASDSFAFYALLFIIFVILISYLIGKSRFKRMIEEYKQINKSNV